jgi:hypothetical protein
LQSLNTKATATSTGSASIRPITEGRLRKAKVGLPAGLAARVLLQDDEPACRSMLTANGYVLFDWGQDTLCVAVR